MSPTELEMLLKNGGFAAIAAVSIVAYFLERKESKRLTKQVIDLATSQVVAQTENRATLQSIKELLAHITRK